jgi:hypothetical protein
MRGAVGDRRMEARHGAARQKSVLQAWISCMRIAFDRIFLSGTRHYASLPTRQLAIAQTSRCTSLRMSKPATVVAKYSGLLTFLIRLRDA